MGLRVYLGNVAVSHESEFTEWNICQIFVDNFGEKLSWLNTNYPDLPIMRRTLMDPAAYQNVYEWYVDFRDTESLMHYKLTYGYEKES